MKCIELGSWVGCCLLVIACGNSDSDAESTGAVDPDTAPVQDVDRFGAGGMLQKRSDNADLPGPNEPIDFDREPFQTRGLAPDGRSVVYYNFDVQPKQPAPIYALFREGEDSPVPGQLNIVDVVPGSAGYNDFWQVTRVTVPADYVANSVTSLAQIESAGYATEATDRLVNCPIVPAGSTASQRFADEPTELVRGWYRGKVVHYFSFDEVMLTGSAVPVAPIFVTFNVNPDQDGGGPASGFKKESGSDQTHNVLSALPTDDGYSPLWSVSAYANADFDAVHDLTSVGEADVLARDVASVNCPVVDVEP